MSAYNIVILLAFFQLTISQHLDNRNLFGHQNEQNSEDVQEDPVVGMGLGLPMLRAATAIPRAKIGAATSLAQAYAVALKARADAHHKIIDNKLRYDLGLSKPLVPGLPSLHPGLPSLNHGLPGLSGLSRAATGLPGLNNGLYGLKHGLSGLNHGITGLAGSPYGLTGFHTGLSSLTPRFKLPGSSILGSTQNGSDKNNEGNIDDEFASTSNSGEDNHDGVSLFGKSAGQQFEPTQGFSPQYESRNGFSAYGERNYDPSTPHFGDFPSYSGNLNNQNDHDLMNRNLQTLLNGNGIFATNNTYQQFESINDYNHPQIGQRNDFSVFGDNLNNQHLNQDEINKNLQALLSGQGIFSRNMDPGNVLNYNPFIEGGHLTPEDLIAVDSLRNRELINAGLQNHGIFRRDINEDIQIETEQIDINNNKENVRETRYIEGGYDLSDEINDTKHKSKINREQNKPSITIWDIPEETVLDVDNNLNDHIFNSSEEMDNSDLKQTANKNDAKMSIITEPKVLDVDNYLNSFKSHEIIKREAETKSVDEENGKISPDLPKAEEYLKENNSTKNVTEERDHFKKESTRKNNIFKNPLLALANLHNISIFNLPLINTHKNSKGKLGETVKTKSNSEEGKWSNAELKNGTSDDYQVNVETELDVKLNDTNNVSQSIEPIALEKGTSIDNSTNNVKLDNEELHLQQDLDHKRFNNTTLEHTLETLNGLNDTFQFKNVSNDAQENSTYTKKQLIEDSNDNPEVKLQSLKEPNWNNVVNNRSEELDVHAITDEHIEDALRILERNEELLKKHSQKIKDVLKKLEKNSYSNNSINEDINKINQPFEDSKITEKSGNVSETSRDVWKDVSSHSREILKDIHHQSTENANNEERNWSEELARDDKSKINTEETKKNKNNDETKDSDKITNEIVFNDILKEDVINSNEETAVIDFKPDLISTEEEFIKNANKHKTGLSKELNINEDENNSDRTHFSESKEENNAQQNESIIVENSSKPSNFNNKEQNIFKETKAKGNIKLNPENKKEIIEKSSGEGMLHNENNLFTDMMNQPEDKSPEESLDSDIEKLLTANNDNGTSEENIERANKAESLENHFSTISDEDDNEVSLRENSNEDELEHLLTTSNEMVITENLLTTSKENGTDTHISENTSSEFVELSPEISNEDGTSPENPITLNSNQEESPEENVAITIDENVTSEEHEPKESSNQEDHNTEKEISDIEDLIEDLEDDEHEHRIRKRHEDMHNMKRDEELFLWSLNNFNGGNGFMRKANGEDEVNPNLHFPRKTITANPNIHINEQNNQNTPFINQNKEFIPKKQCMEDQNLKLQLIDQTKDHKPTSQLLADKNSNIQYIHQNGKQIPKMQFVEDQYSNIQMKEQYNPSLQEDNTNNKKSLLPSILNPNPPLYMNKDEDEIQNSNNKLFEIKGDDNFWKNYNVYYSTLLHPEEIKDTVNIGAKESVDHHSEPRHFKLFGKPKKPLLHIFDKHEKHFGTGDFETHSNFEHSFSSLHSDHRDFNKGWGLNKNGKGFHKGESFHQPLNNPVIPNIVINNNQFSQSLPNQHALNHQFANQQNKPHLSNQQFGYQNDQQFNQHHDKFNQHHDTFNQHHDTFNQQHDKFNQNQFFGKQQGIHAQTPSHLTFTNNQNSFPNSNGNVKVLQAGGSIAQSKATSTNINQFLRSSSNLHDDLHEKIQNSLSANIEESTRMPDANHQHLPFQQTLGQGKANCLGNQNSLAEQNVKNVLMESTQHANQDDIRIQNPNQLNIVPLPDHTSELNNALQNNDEIVNSPYLLQFPYRRLAFHKRTSENFRRKRSLPLVRLMVDPNTKLDMPKTIENVGTIAKKSFEDKRAPMYHVKNMIGATKDAFLSSLKIAPQNVIIPSRYKIVDTKEEIVMKPSDLQRIKNEVRDATRSEFENVGSANPKVSRLDEGKKFPSLKEFFEKMRAKNDILPKIKMNEGLFKNNIFARSKNDYDSDLITPRFSFLKPDTREEDDDQNFLKTFQKVGSVIRDSIKSSQETFNHINNAAHSARKAYTTSKFSLPRILLPYSNAPVVRSTLFDNDNLMMISPRFLDVTEEDVNQPEFPNEYVKMGDIMDAFGVSKPGNDPIGLSRIIIQKKKEPPLLQSRFGGEETAPAGKEFYVISESVDDPKNTESIVVEAFKGLKDIKEMIGVNTVKDFLEEMKREFIALRNSKTRIESRISDAEDGNDDEAELRRFLKELFKNTTKNKVDSNSNIFLDSRSNFEDDTNISSMFVDNISKEDENDSRSNDSDNTFKALSNSKSNTLDQLINTYSDSRSNFNDGQSETPHSDIPNDVVINPKLPLDNTDFNTPVSLPELDIPESIFDHSDSTTKRSVFTTPRSIFDNTHLSNVENYDYKENSHIKTPIENANLSTANSPVDPHNYKSDESNSMPAKRNANNQEIEGGNYKNPQHEKFLGSGMNLPANLFQPFMNQPTKTELEDYFREQGDDLRDISLPKYPENLQEFLKLTGLVSSINPDIYMRLFNESLSVSDYKNVNPAKVFEVVEEPTLKSANREVGEEDQRFSMDIHKSLLKPYMGKIKVKKGGLNYEEFGHPYQGYLEDIGEDYRDDRVDY